MTDSMSLGKRTDTSQPLTEHDVAERLDRAALRTLRIMMDVRQTPGLFEAVKGSRYLTNALEGLAAEIIQSWGIDPVPLKDSSAPLPGLEPGLSEPKSDVLPITPKRTDVT